MIRPTELALLQRTCIPQFKACSSVISRAEEADEWDEWSGWTSPLLPREISPRRAPPHPRRDPRPWRCRSAWSTRRPREPRTSPRPRTRCVSPPQGQGFSTDRPTRSISCDSPFIVGWLFVRSTSRRLNALQRYTTRDLFNQLSQTVEVARLLGIYKTNNNNIRMKAAPLFNRRDGLHRATTPSVSSPARGRRRPRRGPCSSSGTYRRGCPTRRP